MNTKIKLCGMFREKDIDYANSLFPDYVGFVLNFPKSHRSIDIETAKVLKSRLSPKIKAVGVFVDEQIEICAEFVNRGIIDLIQLHGNENAEYIMKLRKLVSVPIIKAVKITSKADVFEAQKTGADYLLLDGGKGEGKAFDHSLLENTVIDTPFFIAGGLTTENVADVIKEIYPFGVDVSSAIETDKIKDINKMTAFINAVRKEI